MTLTTGPNLGLLVNGALGEAHYSELMAQWRGFDLLVQCTVIDMDLNAPPGSPADGDSYIIGPAPSGAWSGHTRKLARWSSVAAAWQIFTPKAGWRAFLQDDLVTMTYASGDWVQKEAPMLAGVNTQGGTSYTFVLADARGRVSRFTAATAVTTIVPVNSTLAFPVGSVITLRQSGDGEVLVTGESGTVVINSPASTFAKTGRKGGVAMLHKVGTNEWDLTGDLAPA